MATTRGRFGRLNRYETVRWRTMEVLGVTESIERKVVTAVGIQFLVTVGIFLAPFVFSGTVWYVVSGVLFGGAFVAIYNTLLIVRRGFTDPIRELERRAGAVAAGELDDRSGATGADARSAEGADERSVEEASIGTGSAASIATDQADEIGSLTDSFTELETYLRTVSAQASALANQEFDDPALDEEVPGTFGDSLSRMADNLETYTTDLEELVTASMTELDRASGEVADSVQAISDGATEQTEELQAVADEMSTLSATVEEIAASADDAAHTAQGAADRSRSGCEASEQQTATVSEVTERTGTLSAQSADLRELLSTFVVDERESGTDGPSSATSTSPGADPEIPMPDATDD